MFMPCPNRIGCEGSDFPIANFTSEDPDRHQFHAINWGWDYTPVPPLNPNGWGGPGPGGSNPDCVNFTTNFTSQQNADICSLTSQIQCANGQTASATESFACDGPSLPSNPNAPDSNTPGKPIFWNTEQKCVEQCPDGTTNTVTVPAGTYNAYSQIMADRIANSYACNQARKNRICIVSLSGFSCVNQAYSVEISASGLTGPFTFAVVQGTLPDGLTLEPDGTLSGTPTAPGNYTFTVQATGAGGTSAQKEMTFEVLGIVTDEILPQATQNSPYSYQLVSGSLADTFALAIGSLPDGLTLSNTGLISGTPTTVQGPTFGITVTDIYLNSCIKYFVLDVAPEPVAGLNWADLLWGVPFLSFTAAGNGHFNFGSIQSDSFDVLVDAPNALVDKATIQCIGTLSYTGPAVNCQVIGNIVKAGLNLAAHSVGTLDIDRTSPGPTISLLQKFFNSDPAGPYTEPFVVPDTSGGPITIRVTLTAQAWAFSTIASHLTLGCTGTISNV